MRQRGEGEVKEKIERKRISSEEYQCPQAFYSVTFFESFQSVVIEREEKVIPVEPRSQE